MLSVCLVSSAYLLRIIGLGNGIREGHFKMNKNSILNLTL
jgi:hypothetical protein